MENKNNIRFKITEEKIYKALLYLIRHKKFSEIYVKDICKVACINRSSFYQHYQDINVLMMQVEQKLSNQIESLFTSSSPFFKHENFVKMFEFIKENKDFYTAYLKNSEESFMMQNDFKKFYEKFKNSIARGEFKENEMVYHMAFFSAGLYAICKVWISTGMKESPEKMAEIIYDEYEKKKKFF